MHAEFEAAGAGFDFDTAAGKGAVDGAVKPLAVADFADGLDGGGEVRAVGGEDGGAGTDAGNADRGSGVGSNVVVEAPGADGVPEEPGLGGLAGVGGKGENATEGWETILDLVAAAGGAVEMNQGAVPIDEQGGGAEDGAVPDTLALDDGVVIELGRAVGGVRGKADIDGVAELLGGETEAEADWIARWGALARRAGPEGGIKAAFGGEGGDDAALGGAGEEAEGAIEVRLAAAIGAGDDVEAAQGEGQAAEGTVVGDGQGVDHAGALGTG